MPIPAPRNLSWPLRGVDDQGRLPYAEDEQSVREVLLNILLTRPGERLMRPDFGAGLLDFIHQPNNETTRHLMADVARKSIEQWEPRVAIEEVVVRAHPASPAEVHLSVHYRLRNTLKPLELGLSLTMQQLA